ncbi:hypothetical protein LLP99_16950 [Rouxiella badensis]|uniref:hypothetical protein n=1 Tax=Rouxiella badensis TaxID=1646377 RepID=UPI001D15B3F0|nr:hypothetical protein [Rouxiella badensis]MCC3717984.1 hypothetical protein [Rouxiella badensis]MCC3730001.1 hypothetical protein [Rouxiella badensis]
MAITKSGVVIFLVVVGLLYYGSAEKSKENERYNSLKSKPISELSSDDRSFIQLKDKEAAEKKISEALQRKKDAANELKAKKREEENKPKPLSEQVLLQNEVIFTCNDLAKNMLSYPESYNTEQTESGISDESGKKTYYYTLHFSGLNAFNVRGIHTIECYGTVGDRSRQVTYRTFN